MKVYIIEKGYQCEPGDIIKVYSNLEKAIEFVKDCIEDMEESTYTPKEVLEESIKEIEEYPLRIVWIENVWIEITEHAVED